MLEERRPLTTKLVVCLHKTIKISKPPNPVNQCCVMMTNFHPGPYIPPLFHVFIINITLEFPFKRKRMYPVRCFKSDHACVEFIIRPDLCGKNGSADMIHTHGKTCISLTVLIHVVA